MYDDVAGISYQVEEVNLEFDSSSSARLSPQFMWPQDIQELDLYCYLYDLLYLLFVNIYLYLIYVVEFT